MGDKKDGDQKGLDEKQLATRQMVARQLKAFSMINQKKRESENKATQGDDAKGPLTPTPQQPASGPRRSRFDIQDKDQEEQAPPAPPPPSAPKIGFGKWNGVVCGF